MSGWIISIFAKGDTFLVPYNNWLLLGVISRFIHPPVHSKKDLPPTYSLSNEKIYKDTNLKEELTDFFFWKLSGIPYSYRQSKESKLNTVLMANIISTR